MSEVCDTNDQIGNLVCDAVPDPPRILNENISNEPNLSQDETNKKESNAPFMNRKDTSTSNSTTKITKNNDVRDTKSKKKSKSKMGTDTTINYNIINSANIKIGPTTKHVYNLNNYHDHDCASTNRSDKEEPKQMLPHVQALSSSQQEITKEDIFLIKTHIGIGWKEVAKRIGFSKGQIEQFLENHKHKGIDEVVYHILIDWKQSCTKDATIGHLVSAMWSSQEYECVEKLAAAYKTV